VRRPFTGPLAGVIIGAAITVVLLAMFGWFIPPKAADMTIFVLSALAIVVASLAVVGAATMVSTLNDIDRRVKTSVEKYEAEAHKDIERNAAERQAVLNSAAERVTNEISQIRNRLNRNNVIFTVCQLALLVAVTVVYLLQVRHFGGKKTPRLPFAKRRR